jgi:hypothetical protein
MASKEKKTAAELAALIMNEFRQYPQLNDIVNVTISPSDQDPANWTASYDVQASRSGPWPVFPEANELIRLFQGDFDLV